MAEQKGSSSKIMVITLVAAVALMAVVVPFAYVGKPIGKAANSDDVDSRIAPVAQLELAKAAPVATGPRDGKTIFETVCAACHATGAAGAPKAGDKAAWAPRIAQGMPALINSVTHGKNAMPAKGGADLSDDEIKSVVKYITDLAK
ncbi:c-type cytochrome [Oryzomicrobium sp.]|uniref:c-type cytochrome n=1 Tax=Oryzomicrobium sp. TaxID=1911578 RepID=UPI0025F1D0A3|nr:c-type cytochrome [Oryzomicrobium sp.]MCE1242328.1 c-type cytochrome [Oryzomicrobium sp.]